MIGVDTAVCTERGVVIPLFGRYQDMGAVGFGGLVVVADQVRKVMYLVKVTYGRLLLLDSVTSIFILDLYVLLQQ